MGTESENLLELFTRLQQKILSPRDIADQAAGVRAMLLLVDTLFTRGRISEEARTLLLSEYSAMRQAIWSSERMLENFSPSSNQDHNEEEEQPTIQKKPSSRCASKFSKERLKEMVKSNVMKIATSCLDSAAIAYALRHAFGEAQSDADHLNASARGAPNLTLPGYNYQHMFLPFSTSAFGAPTEPPSKSQTGFSTANRKCESDNLSSIDPEILKKVKNEVMAVKPNISWDNIAGLQYAKGTITETIVWPLQISGVFTGLREPPKGLLLFGPPGTGKTLIGKCIASQVNATFFSISASSIMSKWMGESEMTVRALFALARQRQPSVIFIDEVDSLLSQRSAQEHECSRRIKTEFLVQLDGVRTSNDTARVIVIGATNRPQELDEAARRRFVKRLYVPMPSTEARRCIVSKLLSSVKNSLTKEDLDYIAEQTKLYSGADMESLCREAAFGPVRRSFANVQDFKSFNPDEIGPVSLEDFKVALRLVRSSVGVESLKQYEDWNRQFGHCTDA